nr:MAG TPA: hypothetical protein [Bacteriophage sp.]
MPQSEVRRMRGMIKILRTGTKKEAELRSSSKYL